ncbi:sulfite exporter TauE/SafE family protein [Limnobaculum zhutongyuii]|uniref:Probable membrane transporter protein n=1 Tax=Limnobaculum zhutongyuii TaxID=2498113 RepID=A0A411WG25_9GAMM|nr:sulfite exporter TauE/SafE family protein [Limnobaculum zhutongyuii]QBH95250.1 sulfite exporter TauE/SafE family protein [Limnobaculum zhutongyuii]TQS89132.1 sulfite exporter TauE/SafE family protein [Limnobaculum zhutongyuii]
MLEHLQWIDLIVIGVGLTIAYIIFGITGFGTALIASPLLAFFIPVDKIVPLLALLDCSAAITNVMRDRKSAVMSEIKRLVPLMIIGSLLGAAILLYTNPDNLLIYLAIFVIAYALYSLSGFKPNTQFTVKASVPFGFIGGIFSALFGSGGFIYAIYLSGRISDKNDIRVTQSTLIGLSTFTRILIFLAAGVYTDWSFLSMALALFPAMIIGVFIGRRITLALSRESFLRIINLVILVSGISLLIRAVI